MFTPFKYIKKFSCYDIFSKIEILKGSSVELYIFATPHSLPIKPRYS